MAKPIETTPILEGDDAYNFVFSKKLYGLPIH